MAGKSETTASSSGASVLSGLQATARARRSQLATRLVIAAIGAFILSRSLGFSFGAVWLSLVLASQLHDLRVWAPFCDSVRTAPPTRPEWGSLCASAAQTTLIYSGFPALMWLMGGSAGKIFATLWFCGALLHVTMHMHHEKRTFIAAITPHAIYFFGLPAYALISGAEPGREPAAWILLAAVLYGMHLHVAFKGHRALSEEMRAARERAQERQSVAEEASRAKSTFLANMSHEIRTPMNGILGMAAALERDALGAEQADKIRTIRESGDHLMAVLNDLLDFSKIEATRMQIEQAPFRLADVARTVESLHAFRAREKGLHYAVNCIGDCSSLRLGDAHRIVQILHNLVSNAVKFTPSGEVRVRIVAPEVGSGAPDVLLEVVDSGIGVDADHAQRIFEPFTQADATTTRRFGGTGLGLSIVKGLAEAMGGDVCLRSEPGAGAAFRVRIPLPLAPMEREAVPRQSDLPDAAVKDGRQGLRILVAEDNAVNRDVAAALLKSIGHRPEFAKNGLDAVAQFRKGGFDLVLMDISMPVMDGVEALREMRFLERELALERTPVVAVSAHAMRQQIDEYMACGFDAYLTKPLRLDQLETEIAQIARSRERAAAVA